MQKTILLIGAESSFGMATALVLASAGHIVYADFRRMMAASGGILAMARRKDMDLRPVAIDAVTQSAMEAAVARVLDETGRLDVLVHNAGSPLCTLPGAVMGQWSGFCDLDMLAINAIRRIVLPVFRSQQEGLIMWISRISPEGSISPYLASYPSTACGSATDDYARDLAHAGIEYCTIVPRCTQPIADGGSGVSAGRVADAVGAIVDLPARKRPLRVTIQCRESRRPEPSLRRRAQRGASLGAPASPGTLRYAGPTSNGPEQNRAQAVGPL